MKRRACSHTPDLFSWGGDLPPVVAAPRPIKGFDLSTKIANAVGMALDQCALSRQEVAAQMGEMLGDSKMSKHVLDKYSAESSTDHKISVERLYALIGVTKQYWLIGALFAEPFSLHLVESEVMRKARLGHIEQQIKQLRAEASSLKKRQP